MVSCVFPKLTTFVVPPPLVLNKNASEIFFLGGMGGILPVLYGIRVPHSAVDLGASSTISLPLPFVGASIRQQRTENPRAILFYLGG